MSARFAPGATAVALFAAIALAQTPAPPQLTWTDIREFGVEGRGWTETKDFYDRLPSKAEGVVRAAVWDLSRDSAGMCVRFTTDANEVHARWTVKRERLAFPTMTATGTSGLDLY